jgi:hypothetical protein
MCAQEHTYHHHTWDQNCIQQCRLLSRLYRECSLCPYCVLVTNLNLDGGSPEMQIVLHSQRCFASLPCGSGVPFSFAVLNLHQAYHSSAWRIPHIPQVLQRPTTLAMLLFLATLVSLCPLNARSHHAFPDCHDENNVQAQERSQPRSRSLSQRIFPQKL